MITLNTQKIHPVLDFDDILYRLAEFFNVVPSDFDILNKDLWTIQETGSPFEVLGEPNWDWLHLAVGDDEIIVGAVRDTCPIHHTTCVVHNGIRIADYVGTWVKDTLEEME